jgi:Holliday junction DNA helicase RuvB
MKTEDVKNFLSEASEEEIEQLERIISYEEKEQKENDRDRSLRGSPTWWRINDTLVPWQLVKKLRLHNILVAAGGRNKVYYLADRKKVKQALSEHRKETDKATKRTETQRTKPIKLPKDLFDIIEGFDDIKEFIKKSLNAEDPVHVLLVGAPGTAKTLFLMELERLGGRFITAGTATRVGIQDVLFEETPRILIIDEIEKISGQNELSALLTWMESGRIIVTKHGVQGEKTGKGWVFAACNTDEKLTQELKDRFQIFHLKPYTREEFRRIVANYLIKRMNVRKDMAAYIAEKVGEYSTSVREAIRVARISKTKKDVDNNVAIIRKYKESNNTD